MNRFDQISISCHNKKNCQRHHSQESNPNNWWYHFRASVRWLRKAPIPDASIKRFWNDYAINHTWNKITRSQRSEFWLIFGCLRNLLRRLALCSSHQFRLSPLLFTVPIILHYVFELLISQQLAVIDVSSCLDVYETSREEQWPYETSDSLESMTTKKSNKKLLLVIYEAVRMVTSHRECHYREWIWIVGLPTHKLRFRYLCSRRKKKSGEEKEAKVSHDDLRLFHRSHSGSLLPFNSRPKTTERKEGEKN